MALEAMSCGTPVIMLDNEDRAPLVDKVTGFLLDSKNLDIEDKMDYFLATVVHIMYETD
jgi:glycosyltransferase involved in cell wall biosynthesis